MEGEINIAWWYYPPSGDTQPICENCEPKTNSGERTVSRFGYHLGRFLLEDDDLDAHCYACANCGYNDMGELGDPDDVH